jgi:general secretion pathway protein I
LKPPNAQVRAQTSRGFTLIEVMAALIIVSLGMMAVIQAVSETASNSVYLREKSVAHWVAMNRVTDMRLAVQAPPTGETSGEVEMAGKRWRWSAQVTQTQLTTMRRIDVSVAPLSDAKTSVDEHSQYATITGFYGDKIAQPGTVFAQFDVPPPTRAGQPGSPSNPGQPTPPSKIPVPDTKQ